ncbi:hypothetical protein Agub_g3806 [Astrephomene gubernaculifera]|uniref:J domain-containing protein n=1 Tax=Astrephomene gubernaculifera TaxID=47775 RepID=A0AAD3DLM2_9CHLO|nr:hypothetical protein Agub_g3806 [Astrephomene gubernaculifera]
MATTELLSAYGTLGIQANATKAEVKEAFVRLCKQYHPDKVSADQRIVAEARFREIKSAYDTILRGQAGYSVPPPGSAPNAKYAREYYRAHGMGMEFGEGGPIRCGGPFGGYATETDFYRSMLRSTRNNPFVLIVAGLVAVPLVAVTVSVANGNTGWIKRFRDQGIHAFGDAGIRANGRNTVTVNPFAIRRLDEIEESYIYKSEKYAHLRRPIAAVAAANAAGVAPAPAPSS